MSQYVWRLWRLAWMRADCIPYGGKINGWTRIASRLFWRSGYSLALRLHCAYRQGWIDGDGTKPGRDFDKLASESDRLAERYVQLVLGERE